MTLRITGGAFRGKNLLTLKNTCIRPTGARAREAIFNRLTHGLLNKANTKLERIHVVDTFAGSGIMGFEALSRGNLHTTFIDISHEATNLITHNARRLNLEKYVNVHQEDVTNLRTNQDACGLAFVDAPYFSGLSKPALIALANQGWLAKEALVVVETNHKDRCPVPPNFEVIDSRVYGLAKITFLRYL